MKRQTIKILHIIISITQTLSEKIKYRETTTKPGLVAHDFEEQKIDTSEQNNTSEK